MRGPKKQKPPKVEKASGMRHAAHLLRVSIDAMKEARRECPEAFDSHNRVDLATLRQWLSQKQASANASRPPAQRFRHLLITQFRAAISLAKAWNEHRDAMVQMLDLWEECEKNGTFSELQIPTGPNGKHLGNALKAFDKLSPHVLKLQSEWCELDIAWQISGYVPTDKTNE